MNKTCKGCYAAITGSHPMTGNPHGCELGYNTDGNGKPRFAYAISVGGGRMKKKVINALGCTVARWILRNCEDAPCN